jgi:hypothetical protein
MSAEETEQKNLPDKFCIGGRIELISIIGGFRKYLEIWRGFLAGFEKVGKVTEASEKINYFLSICGHEKIV